MKIKIISILTLAMLMSAAAAEYCGRDKPANVIETDTYIVQQGDTLWSIAKEHCPEDMDIREYIDDIKARNRLAGAAVYRGQEIEIWTIEKSAGKAD